MFRVVVKSAGPILLTKILQLGYWLYHLGLFFRSKYILEIQANEK